ncbi:hypothetical protein PsorP6_012481 [Peronosclerospora sorghi]|uniref:Uncharacterized protein n=1 Tax=Peronosclerospora sorghi TaxID=230839 RepID=A0ACC0WH24_9STRA|nr:hypothetical protein PsorP6_012481 [Peronosclerospora sorghi]
MKPHIGAQDEISNFGGQTRICSCVMASLRYVDVSAWDSTSTEWQQLMVQLPAHEQEQVTRFLFEKDQKLALASHVVQRKLIRDLFRVKYDAIDIRRTPENKPYWSRPRENTAPPSWNYNVSHHGNIVAIASASHALIGVDVVRVTDRPHSKTSVEAFFRAFIDHFNPSEWEYIRGETSARDEASQYVRFYQLWSLKEAFIKAVGAGLGFSLLRAEFVQGKSAQWELFLDGKQAVEWHFTSTQIDPMHLVSVAYGPFSAMWKPETSSLFPHLEVWEQVCRTTSEEPQEVAKWKEWKQDDLLQLS